MRPYEIEQQQKKHESCLENIHILIKLKRGRPFQCSEISFLA